MKKEDAISIPIEGYLSSIGIEVSKSVGSDLWYSIRQDDKTPSCKVCTKLNRWYDFGQGKGGNIIDLVQYINGYNFHQAMLELEGKSSVISKFNSEDFKIESKIQNSIILLKEKNIFSFPLKNYLIERGIDLDIANKYLREIEFELKGKKQYALGLKNDKGGFEIRNKLLKSSVGSKSPTTINPGKDKLVILEGMFDFLSFISDYPQAEKTYTFKILNTISYINYDISDSKAIALHKLQNIFKDELSKVEIKVITDHNCYSDIIKNLPYTSFHLMLDNDSSGDQAVNIFTSTFSESKVIDQRDIFEGSIDYNEHLLNNLSNKTKKTRL